MLHMCRRRIWQETCKHLMTVRGSRFNDGCIDRKTRRKPLLQTGPVVSPHVLLVQTDAPGSHVADQWPLSVPKVQTAVPGALGEPLNGANVRFRAPYSGPLFLRIARIPVFHNGVFAR